MGDDDPSLFRSVKSKTSSAFGLRHDKDTQPVLPQHETFRARGTAEPSRTQSSEKPTNTHLEPEARDVRQGRNGDNDLQDQTPVDHSVKEANSTIASKPKFSYACIKDGTGRFHQHTKNALLYSWINVLLVFVPIGIASHFAHLSPEIVFSMNALAIIPLAGLLSYATEAVATRLGDTLGALLNVSFGNAVELILFIILLADNQIRVVQAALLGSILANLLLIMGMAFLLGGLRYQEQLYNNTVTQMSACMLSLSVMSLLLPTAFHAAFSNYSTADKQTLHVSRGTSVILLLVYVLYLIFQLKSHSYLYASTPQHIIDEESHPGFLANMLDSSSSSNSSDSDSTASHSSAGSRTATKRIKRAFKHRMRRMSTNSKETSSAPSVGAKQQTPASRGGSVVSGGSSNLNHGALRGSTVDGMMSGDEADTDEHPYPPAIRDFETEACKAKDANGRDKQETKYKKKDRRRRHRDVHEQPTNASNLFASAPGIQTTAAPTPTSRRPGLSSLLSNNVFNNPQNPPPPGISALSNVRMAGPRDVLRRTKSMPERMGPPQANTVTTDPPQGAPSEGPGATEEGDEEDHSYIMSRTAAVVMLLISTGLVAVCADFMTEAIEPMVEKTDISQAFIGLIILPMVGNAAEHVTAVTVAAKNKMDLSIGVALGSSIQIAIFITPFIVILGWIMHKEMSLYFNIFETVALFVTAFVVNFLILDGRSNYLEGSLLVAAYIIIALASFFYPDGCDASQIGGQEGRC